MNTYRVICTATNAVVNTIIIGCLDDFPCPVGYRLEKVEVPAPGPPPTMTHLAFRLRLSAEERIAISAAADSHPIIKDFLDLLNSARNVDLELY